MTERLSHDMIAEVTDQPMRRAGTGSHGAAQPGCERPFRAPAGYRPRAWLMSARRSWATHHAKWPSLPSGVNALLVAAA
jgi:hypothetical protein